MMKWTISILNTQQCTYHNTQNKITHVNLTILRRYKHEFKKHTHLAYNMIEMILAPHIDLMTLN